MTGVGGGREGGSDNLVPAVILGVIIVLVAWMGLRTHLIAGSMWLLRAEAVVIEPVVRSLGTDAQNVAWDRWRQQLATAPKEMSPGRLVRGLNAGGAWLRWPVLLAAFALAYWVYRRSPVTRYSRTMDFEGLLLEQQLTFPRIRPVLWLKGRHHDKDRGAYTWALSPYEWAVRQRVIVSTPDTAATQASFDAARAHAGFVAQLGEPFQVDQMPYHAQVLFAAIGARCIDDRATSDTILDAVSAGFQPVGWNKGWAAMWRRWNGRQWAWPADATFEIVVTPAVDKLITSTIKKVADHARTRKVLERHHHLHSALAALLQLARERQGTLTSSDFIWLKAVDRVMHYALNDVGRRVASVEASGIRSHMQFERTHGAARAPQVGAAVDSLRKSLSESGWQAPPSWEFDEDTLAAADEAANEARLDESEPESAETTVAASRGSGGFGAGMAPGTAPPSPATGYVAKGNSVR